MSRFGGGTAAAVLATALALSGVAGWAPVAQPPVVAEDRAGGDPFIGFEDPGAPDIFDRPRRPGPRGTDEAIPVPGPGVSPLLRDAIRKPTVPRPDGDVPFELVEKGFWSYYRYGDLGFGGGCLAIRDNNTWSLFWSVHKSDVWPEPAPPAVDFSSYIVVACIQGTWTDCCMTYVEIVGIRSSGGEYVVSVVRHYEHGMLMALTNPYCIVTTERTEGPVRFIDANTGAQVSELPPVP